MRWSWVSSLLIRYFLAYDTRAETILVVICSRATERQTQPWLDVYRALDVTRNYTGL